jgi:iron complex outermembrane recepter protein
MKYRDQLVLTGQLNDVGAYVRDNVGRFLPLGIGIGWAYMISENLPWEVICIEQE